MHNEHRPPDKYSLPVKTAKDNVQGIKTFPYTSNFQKKHSLHHKALYRRQNTIYRVKNSHYNLGPLGKSPPCAVCGWNTVRHINTASWQNIFVHRMSYINHQLPKNLSTVWHHWWSKYSPSQRTSISLTPTITHASPTHKTWHVQNLKGYFDAYSYLQEVENSKRQCSYWNVHERWSYVSSSIPRNLVVSLSFS